MQFRGTTNGMPVLRCLLRDNLLRDIRPFVGSAYVAVLSQTHFGRHRHRLLLLLLLLTRGDVVRIGRNDLISSLLVEILGGKVFLETTSLFDLHPFPLFPLSLGFQFPLFLLFGFPSFLVGQAALFGSNAFLLFFFFFFPFPCGTCDFFVVNRQRAFSARVDDVSSTTGSTILVNNVGLCYRHGRSLEGLRRCAFESTVAIGRRDRVGHGHNLVVFGLGPIQRGERRRIEIREIGRAHV